MFDIRFFIRLWAIIGFKIFFFKLEIKYSASDVENGVDFKYSCCISGNEIDYYITII